MTTQLNATNKNRGAWRQFYLFGGSFRILEILLYLGLNVTFLAGHGYSGLTIFAALLGVAALTLLTVTVIQYFDQKQDGDLDEKQTTLNEILAKLTENHVQDSELIAAKKKQLNKMRLYRIMMIIMVFSAGATIFNTLGRWLSGPKVTHVPIELITLSLIFALCICAYRKDDYNAKLITLRAKGKLVVERIKGLGQAALTILSPTNTPIPTIRKQITIRGIHSPQKHHSHHYQSISNFKPNLKWHEKVLTYGLVPAWNFLSTVFGVIYLLDFITSITIGTPSLFSLSQPWWLFALELITALAITIPYMVYRCRDAHEDITLVKLSNAHQDFLMRLVPADDLRPKAGSSSSASGKIECDDAELVSTKLLKLANTNQR